MLRPNKRKLARIGLVIVVVSLVLFSISVVLLLEGTSTYSNVDLNPGSTNKYVRAGVAAGDDVQYSVALQGFGIANQTNVTVHFLSPTGVMFENATLTVNNTAHSAVMVANESGNWTLVVTNHGSNKLVITAKIGDINYANTFTLIFGFALLPCGIVLIGISAYSNYMEKRKNKMRDSFK